MRYLIFFVLLVAAASARAAQPVDTAPDGAPISGIGLNSCGQFVEHYKQNNPPQMYLYEQWAWGFLSAYNVRGNFGTQWHRVTKIQMPDAPSLLLYFETYCHKHPTYNVMDATIALINEQNGSVTWR